MIRKAHYTDIKEIMNIIRDTVVEMHSDGNTQWDETYPQENDFLKDIQKGDLYVCERDGNLVGFACINKIEPPEYMGLPWSKKDTAMIIHRMAVSQYYRRSGIGTELMAFADQFAVQNNVQYLKTDTYSINTKMNTMFLKCGYKRAGEMIFRSKEKPFYCYEKVLNKR
ncbi:MAG: GNAT family N-acetyltransferase [Pelosinus sp.]|nr:GNAT family N-acetyltransferase [Pelosinus sp.]